MSTAKLPLIGKTNMKMNTKTIGYIAAGFTILTSSTSASFTKVLSGVFSPLSLLLVSESLSLLFMCLSFGLIPVVEELKTLKRQQIPYLLIVGILSSIIAPLLAFTGISMTQAANAEIFLRAEMLFLFIFSVLILHENVTRKHVLAGMMVMFGIIMVALKGFQSGMVTNPGDLYLVSAALIYGLGSIIFKRYLSDIHPELVIFMRGLIAITFILLIYPFTNQTIVSELATFPVALIGVLIGYGFFSKFFGLYSFYEAMERLEVHTLSLILPISTVGSVSFAYLYLGENILWYHIAGGACIVFGSIMMQFSTEHLKEKKHLDRHLRHHRRHV